ncbi:MAG TPA: MIP/aquaporin family protein [Vicinamibacterales bacterium]|nr:MIP/aquaporin family protein [Vicinamibacterales bacterium]
MAPDARRRLTAEAVGTALLLAAVVGSGIMADRLAAGNEAIALLANTIATGAALVALILTFGPVSGAHFNPAVTIADASQGGLAWREVPGYLCAHIGGAVLGVWAAHLMFGEPVFVLSLHQRSGSAQMFSEFVAAFGLLAVIWGCSRRRTDIVPFAVAAYITSALVYGLDLVRESRGNVCPRSDRHVRRHSSTRHPRLHRRAVCRRGGVDAALQMARACASPNR